MSEKSRTSTPDQVERAIEGLRAFHRLGRNSLKKHPRQMPPGVAAKLGERHGMHAETVRHARRFASPAHGGYSARDLRRLFGRARRYGHALSRTNVTKLLTIADPAVRSELELAMIAGGWSRRRLDDEIRRRYGKRMHAGRRPRRSLDTQDAALQVLRAAEQARRVFKQYGASGVSDVSLPPQLLEETQRAVEPLERVAHAAEKLVGDR